MTRPASRHPHRRAMVVLSALALLLGLLPGTSAAAALSARLAPEAGGTAARQGAPVRISGEGPANGTITSAFVVAVYGDARDPVRCTDVDPQPVECAPFSEAALNGPSTRTTHIRLDGEALSGRFVLGCVFARDPQFCPERRGTPQAVLVELTVAGTTVRSPLLPLDNLDPRLTRFELVSTSVVRAVFSESVVAPGGDLALDWQVAEDGAQSPVTGVSAGTGPCLPPTTADLTPASTCTRDLSLGRPLSEDALPSVTYAPAPSRPGYTDVNGNTIDRSSAGPVPLSLDRVRPAAPRIASIDGKTPTGTRPRVDSAAPSPVVSLRGLTSGHQGLVRSTPPSGPPRESAAVTATGTGAPPDTTASASVTLGPLGQVGTHVLQAVALDVNGNRSDAALAAPRADGSPAIADYGYDPVAPVLLGAVVQGGRSLVVSFSETVTGSDVATAWRVQPPVGLPITVTAVSGTGAQRTLTAASDVPAGSVLLYRPTDAQRYRDAAGNGLADADVPLDGLPVPVVTRPEAPFFERGGSTVVAGTAEPGSTVEIFRDTNGDGRPDGAALLSGPASPGFSLTVPLLSDVANRFVVVASRPSGTRSAPATVPTVTQDGTQPELTLQSPDGGEVLAGNTSVPVAYTYSDTNEVGVDVALSLDGGATFTALPPAPPRGGYSLRTPSRTVEQAVLRLTALDLAGNQRVVTSGTFVIDAEPPGFAALTVDPQTVLVTFSEPLPFGSSGVLDWRLDDRAVGGVQEVRGPTGVTAVRLTLAPGQSLGPDARPLVEYRPAPTSTVYADRARQVVPQAARTRTAADGIRPATPTITAPTTEQLTTARELTVSGRAQPGRVEVQDGSGVVLASGPVAADGTWSIVVPLATDTRNLLRAAAVDGNANRSTGVAQVAPVEQDASAPVVTVSAPTTGTRVEPGQQVEVRWRSTDRNLVSGQTLVETSTDAGGSWTTLVAGTTPSGSATWTVPAQVTDDARVRVTTPDRVGRRGVGTAGPLGVGRDAKAAPAPVPALPALGTFTALPAGRLLDTRDGNRPLGADGRRTVPVAGRAGVPTVGVSAVVVNLTAVQAGAATHLSLVPSGRDPLPTANLTAAKGATIANLVTVRLGPDGALLLRNEAGRTHAIVDVLGYYADEDGPPGEPFSPLAPARLLDTRNGTGAPTGVLRRGRVLDLQVTGRGGVPATGVGSVVLDLAAVGPTGSTHVTAWPTGSTQPATSNLNLPARSTRANLVVVPVGPQGRVSLTALATDLHLVADVFGWYGPEATTTFRPLDPSRVLDTRPTRSPATDARALVLPVAGRGGVPATGARAVVLQLTAVAPSDSTHVTAYAGGANEPATANLNATRGSTVSALVVVPVGADGTVRLAVGKGRVHLVADVAGWFGAP